MKLSLPQSLTISYFAYGSNLSKSILSRRTLSSSGPFASTEILPPKRVRVFGHKTVFNLGVPGSSVASLEESSSNDSEGLVWSLNARQWALLCASEGAGLAYSVKQVEGENIDDENERVLAYTFTSGRGTENIPTSRRYYDILMDGAREWDLKELERYLEDEVEVG